jgi:NADH-quinone oxidoreductase subunit H
LIFKAAVGVTVMMWIRWTLPRLRIDQVMTTCLKYCVPLAAIFFVGAMLWKLYIPWFSINEIAPLHGRRLGDVRESWVLAPNAVGEAPPAKTPPAIPAKPAHPAAAKDEPVALTPTSKEVQP